MATKPHPSASLYVGDLSSEVTEGMLFEIFNQVGPIASIRVCRDVVTRRSLEYAYINFHNIVDAERALDTLNNKMIRGKPCRIMWSHRDPSIRKSGVGNIFIKNLDSSIGHQELYDYFSVYGNILSCKVAIDEQSGMSKGFGFVHYDNVDAADKAIEKMNDQFLGMKKVFVGKFVSKRDRLKAQETTWTNVYVKEIDPAVTDEQFESTFSEYGKITSAVIMRNLDGTSKGFGFVNFEMHENAVKAVNTLQGQQLGSKALWCGRAQKKNERRPELLKRFEHFRIDRQVKLQGINLYIKNLEDDIDENRLKQEFSGFGTIRSLKVMMDEKGFSRGFGFICYNTPEEAQRAINEMNSRTLLGYTKPLYVAFHEPKEIRRAKLAAQYDSLRSKIPVPAPVHFQGIYYNNGNNIVFPAPPRNVKIPPMEMYTPYIPPPVPTRGGGRSNVIYRGGSSGRGGGRNRRNQGAVVQTKPVVVDSVFQHLMALPPEHQKLFLGERLYPIIQKIQPNFCGKITGMLLEYADWSIEDIYSLIHDEEKLQAKVDEAVLVLEQAEYMGEPEGNGTTNSEPKIM